MMEQIWSLIALLYVHCLIPKESTEECYRRVPDFLFLGFIWRSLKLLSAGQIFQNKTFSGFPQITFFIQFWCFFCLRRKAALFGWFGRVNVHTYVYQARPPQAFIRRCVISLEQFWHTHYWVGWVAYIVYQVITMKGNVFKQHGQALCCCAVSYSIIPNSNL